MLLKFSIANYRSFRDEATFDMIPADLSDEGKDEHLIKDNSGPGKREGRLVFTLPISAIYGANASGKSNFTKALDFVNEYVCNGPVLSKNGQSKKKINRTPFLLDEQGKENPSRFEIVFKTQGVVYTYGFAVTSDKVMEEWLLAYFTPKTHTLLFERKNQDGKTVFNFGSKLAELEGEKADKWVPEATLFLTFAHNKSEVLSPVFQWFTNLRVISLRSIYQLAKHVTENIEFKKFISNKLSIADTGIYGLIGNKEEITPELLQSLPEELQDLQADMQLELFPQKKKRILYYLQTEHKKENEEIVKFPLKYESDGTRRLLHLLPILYWFSQKDGIFIVDELDNSLHPLLSRWFIKSFIELEKQKGCQNQFIFTTHDTNLLDRSLLRRDEIWFTEKDAIGATHFTRLSEYQGTENLNYEKGYLNGRFGAIPFIRSNGDL